MLLNFSSFFIVQIWSLNIVSQFLRHHKLSANSIPCHNHTHMLRLNVVGMSLRLACSQQIWLYGWAHGSLKHKPTIFSNPSKLMHEIVLLLSNHILDHYYFLVMNCCIKTCNKAATWDEKPCRIFERPMIQIHGIFFTFENLRVQI